ncbi:MAG: 50S ribosomal protein L5 [Candidatus Woesearchaeota archaeon]|nr:MAG: 50S ribosomal protein L5 [Candidatus Woesearchaeota archaeon]
MNPMTEIKVSKLTLNIGAGRDEQVLKKGMKLIKNLTGIEPVKTITQKRIASWGLRPGLPVGCKLTLRGEEALKMIPRLLSAKSHELKISYFDDNGNISFGIPEYIDIADAKYDVDIGITGLQASITLERPGYRIKRRKARKGKIAQTHRITRDQAIAFMKQAFEVKLGETA